MIDVKFYGSFREIVGQGNLHIDSAEIKTILDLIHYFTVAYGNRFRDAVIQGDRLRDNVNILIDGRNIRFGAGLASPIPSPARIVFLPSLVGG